jgi:demethoxyubiquinone hydroxylase (CLK1/Coq7/Cat5 family)
MSCGLDGRRQGESNSLEGVIRSVHAAEIFRASFLEASRSSDRISPSDLDDVVISKNVRPSIFVGLYEMGGKVLGTAAKIGPPNFAQIVSKVVNDAAIQQFNDGIRDIQQCGDPHALGDMDLKETIKYHRDLELRQFVNTSTSSDIALPLGTALLNALKISKTL